MPESKRPTPSEYAPYVERYIALVEGDEIIPVLAAQVDAVRRSFAAVPPARAGYRYAEGKWSVREVLGHLIDTERVIAYRALSFARAERQALPGFDENQYASAAGHDAVPLKELIEEFAHVRAASVLLFRHLPAEAWTRAGTANANPLSVRAAAFMIAGHVEHHLAILFDRYRVGL